MVSLVTSGQHWSASAIKERVTYGNNLEDSKDIRYAPSNEYFPASGIVGHVRVCIAMPLPALSRTIMTRFLRPKLHTGCRYVGK